MADFLSEMMQARNPWDSIFQVFKDQKKSQTSNLDSTLSKNGKIQISLEYKCCKNSSPVETHPNECYRRSSWQRKMAPDRSLDLHKGMTSPQNGKQKRQLFQFYLYLNDKQNIVYLCYAFITSPWFLASVSVDSGLWHPDRGKQCIFILYP